MDSQVLNWLLEEENPSVRYTSLTTVLGKGEDDAEVVETKRSIMEHGMVKLILEKQHSGGWWGQPERFYIDKYGGTVWNLLLLAELGADGSHPKVKAACEFILSHSWEASSGGFSTGESRRTGKALGNLVIPCLTGNMVFALIRLGYLDDPRVQKSIEWICTYQRTDDGAFSPPQGEMYDRYRDCWGAHSCHMGVAKTLKALAAIPEKSRSQLTQEKLDALVEYFLKHHIYKRSHHLDTISKPGWTRFGFPLMYQSDILELLDIMASLHIHDPRLQEAIELVKDKQLANGTWKLANSFNDRLLVPSEEKGKPSKWITLRALRVLKEYDTSV